MKNIISTRLPGIVLQAQKALPAVIRDAMRLGLGHINGATMSLHLENLLEARRVVDFAKVDLAGQRKVQNTLFVTGRRHVATARNLLTFFLGNEPTESWTHAGYEGSLAIPRAIGPLVTMLQRLSCYLNAHPDHENAALNVTAAATKTLATDLLAAYVAVKAEKSKVRKAIKDRDAKLQLVRLDLRTLLAELKLVLDPMNPLWEQFGFKRPGVQQTPDAPENVEVKWITPTVAMIKVEKPARARRLRVWQKTEGVDAEFVLVKTGRDFIFMHELTAKAEVHLAFSTSNRGGESPRSNIVTLKTGDGLLPLVLTRTAAPGSDLVSPL